MWNETERKMSKNKRVSKIAMWFSPDGFLEVHIMRYGAMYIRKYARYPNSPSYKRLLLVLATYKG
jgi:hypothetical protein